MVEEYVRSLPAEDGENRAKKALFEHPGSTSMSGFHIRSLDNRIERPARKGESRWR